MSCSPKYLQNRELNWDNKTSENVANFKYLEAAVTNRIYIHVEGLLSYWCYLVLTKKTFAIKQLCFPFLCSLSWKMTENFGSLKGKRRIYRMHTPS